jgi:hypothetical protein
MVAHCRRRYCLRQLIVSANPVRSLHQSDFALYHAQALGGGHGVGQLATNLRDFGHPQKGRDLPQDQERQQPSLQRFRRHC